MVGFNKFADSRRISKSIPAISPVGGLFFTTIGRTWRIKKHREISPACLYIPCQIRHNRHNMKSLQDAPQIATNGIPAHSGRFYGQSTKTDANVRRLRAICRMFGLGPTAVAKAGGVSQPYVSRILSDNDPIVGNPEFYRRLEGKLGGLIESRGTQFFRVSPSPIRRVENAVEQSSL
jgi:hypothetical protein